ncbi:MAG: hypothetical protein KDB07_12660, partial [Planctomycetes bacterium]|nr:hypothetical protein [Planctomycetota bacterium]
MLKSALLLLALSLCLTLAACGGDDEPETKTTTPAQTSTSTEKVAPSETHVTVTGHQDEVLKGVVVCVLEPYVAEPIRQVSGESFVRVPIGAKRIAVQADNYVGREFTLSGQPELRVGLLKLAQGQVRFRSAKGLDIPHLGVRVTRKIANVSGVFEAASIGKPEPLQAEVSTVMTTDLEGRIRLEGLVPSASYTFEPQVDGFASRLAEGPI